MTVSEQIIQVINTLCEKFGIAINWTSENVIPYIEVLCRKLVTYEICTSVMWIVFWLALSISAMIATKKFYPAFKAGLDDWDNDGWIFGTVFSIAGLVIIYITSIAVITIETGDIIKCLTFPEMYVFEYVSALLKSA